MSRPLLALFALPIAAMSAACGAPAPSTPRSSPAAASASSSSPPAPLGPPETPARVGCQKTAAATAGAACDGQAAPCEFQDENAWCFCPREGANGPAPGIAQVATAYVCTPLRRPDGCPVSASPGMRCAREGARCEYRRPCAAAGRELVDATVCAKGAWQEEQPRMPCPDDVRPGPGR